MNYELAKRLKDAGFPMEFYDMTVCPPDAPEVLPWPALSGLIRACGDGFHCLYRISAANEKQWLACESGDVTESAVADGETPEEAVGELWLVLNKKK